MIFSIRPLFEIASTEGSALCCAAAEPRCKSPIATTLPASKRASRKD